MIKYKIKLPLELEQKASCNKHNFSSSECINFQYENNDFSIKGSEGKYSIVLEDIIANNKDECSKIVEKEVSKILKICSLLIQTQHSNQHYTHLRLNFNINNISFIEETEMKNPMNIHNNVMLDRIGLSYKGKVKNTQDIKLDSYEEIKKYVDDKAFQIVLDDYYRAIDSTDPITKYFNSFSAIEFIEGYFKKHIQTNKLVSEDIIDSMIQSLESKVAPDTFSRIKERIRSNLIDATLESRADKLLNIIKNIFNINEIASGIIYKEMKIDFIQEIIKIRNSLFHGKKIDETEMSEFRYKTLELILLLQYLLVNWKIIDNHLTLAST